jgi:hypothetical protein
MAVRRPPSDNLKSLRALSQSPPHRPARKSLPCQTQARRDDPLHASPLWARCHMAFFERHADAGKLRVCETAILHCLWRARLATAHNPAASQSGASVGSNNREHKRSNPVSQPAPQRSLRHPRTQYARPCVVRSCDAGLRSRLRPCLAVQHLGNVPPPVPDLRRASPAFLPYPAHHGDPISASEL